MLQPPKGSLPWYCSVIWPGIWYIPARCRDVLRTRTRSRTPLEVSKLLIIYNINIKNTLSQVYFIISFNLGNTLQFDMFTEINSNNGFDHLKLFYLMTAWKMVNYRIQIQILFQWFPISLVIPLSYCISSSKLLPISSWMLRLLLRCSIQMQALRPMISDIPCKTLHPTAYVVQFQSTQDHKIVIVMEKNIGVSMTNGTLQDWK